MALPPLQKASAPFLAWIGGLCAAILLLLGDLLPFRLPWTGPTLFFTCVVQIELFLALLVWPLFVPGLLRDGARPWQLRMHVAALLLFALPLVLIGANVSAVRGAEVFVTQMLVAGAALLGAGVASIRGRAAMPVYLLGIFLVSALLPFWAFLENELRLPAPSFAPYLSPFFAVTMGGKAWGHMVLGTAAGLALLRKAEKATA